MKNALLLALFFVGVNNGRPGSGDAVTLSFSTKAAACAYWAKNADKVLADSRIYSAKSATTSTVTWKAYTCP